MRGLLTLILILVLGFVVWTYMGRPGASPTTSPEGPIDPAKARQTGAEIGEKTARAANQVAKKVEQVATGAAGALKRESGEAGAKAEKAASEAKKEGGEIAADAKERGAEAVAGAGDALSDATITTKIKSKMALDDLVKARTIDVDTSKGVVTLTGDVASARERDRAVTIASETAGVKQIVDRLQVK
jgi:hyperosmotically inducible periplasmic protein